MKKNYEINQVIQIDVLMRAQNIHVSFSRDCFQLKQEQNVRTSLVLGVNYCKKLIED